MRGIRNGFGRSLLAMLFCGFVGPVVAEPFAYVALSSYHQVAVVDIATNTKVKVIDLAPGANPYGVAVSLSTPRAYVANFGNNTMSVIDTDTQTLIGSVTVQNNPWGVAVNRAGTRAYVSNQSSGTVSVIDTVSLTVIATIPAPDSPTAVTVSPDDSRIYVAPFGGASVYVIDAATNAQIANVPLGGFSPVRIVARADGKRLYVATVGANTIAVIDTTNNTRIATIPMSPEPRGAALSPDGTLLYVIRDATTNTLSKVDLATGGVLSSVPVGAASNPFPASVNLNPEGTRAYITDFQVSTLTVIDTATMTLVQNIALNTSGAHAKPYAVGEFVGGRGRPGAPLIGTAVAGNAAVTVAFSPPTFWGGMPLSGYTATCGAQSATGASSPILVGGLPNGVPVTCTVHATNTVGDGASSAPSNSVVPGAVPGAPTITAVTPGITQLSVAFDAPPDDGGFAITQYTARCGVRSATGASSPVIVTGLIGGVDVACTVSATNARGEGAQSAPMHGAALLTVPDAPTIGTATPGDALATITFAAPANNGGAAIDHFTATCTPGPVGVQGTASPIVVAGLTNGTLYDCSITATNMVGTGAASATRQVRPSRPPDPPTAVMATAGDTQIMVSFLAPVDLGGGTLQQYTATCGSQSTSGPAAPLVVSSLVNGETVACTVTAHTQYGMTTSTPSNAVTPKRTTTLSLAGPSAATPAGAQATFVATVSPANATGTIVFQRSDAASPSCTQPVSGGTASCVEAFGAIGTFTMDARFEATPAFADSSASTTHSVIVPTITIDGTIVGGVVGDVHAPVTLTGSGGVAPYTFALGNGTFLPRGLALSSQGVLDGTLLEAGDHAFTIVATDANGFAGSRAYTLLVQGLPGAPRILTITPAASSASLAFTAPDLDGHSPVLDYGVSCLPGPVLATVTTSPGVITGLTPNHAYRCHMTARNAIGVGPPSEERNVIPGAGGTSADLSITKTNALVFVDDGNYVDYLITVTNHGPAAVMGARVEDPIGSGFLGAMWRCTSTPQALCAPAGIDGLDIRVDLAVGASLEIVFSALPTGGVDDPLINQATVSPPPGIDDPDLADNVATDGPDIRGVFRDQFE